MRRELYASASVKSQSLQMEIFQLFLVCLIFQHIRTRKIPCMNSFRKNILNVCDMQIGFNEGKWQSKLEKCSCVMSDKRRRRVEHFSMLSSSSSPLLRHFILFPQIHMISSTHRYLCSSISSSFTHISSPIQPSLDNFENTKSNICSIQNIHNVYELFPTHRWDKKKWFE